MSSEGHFDSFQKSENPSPCWTGFLIGYLISSVITSVSMTGSMSSDGMRVAM